MLKSNYLCAIRAKFIVHCLLVFFLDDTILHYNRPLCISKCNIFSVDQLYDIGTCGDLMWDRSIFLCWPSLDSFIHLIRDHILSKIMISPAGGKGII